MAKKIALLLGNTDFRDESLGALAAPADDVTAFVRVLRDVCQFETIQQIGAGLVEARSAVSDLFANRRPDDTLLIYYTGHGIRDDAGRLHLALPQTDLRRLRATALSTAFIRDEMEHSFSRRQVMILDCCHSGAVMQDGAKRSGEDRLAQDDFIDPRGYGKFVLTACAAQESAFERGGQSLFTKHLVTGLANGSAAPEKEEITIRDLHDYLCRKVPEEQAPMMPRIWVDEQVRDLVIGRNPDPIRRAPTDLRAMLWDPDPHKAFYAASRLIEMLDEGDDRLAADITSLFEQRLEKPESLSLSVARPIEKALMPDPVSTEDPRIALLEREFSDRDDLLKKSKREVEIEKQTYQEELEKSERDLRDLSQQREHLISRLEQSDADRLSEKNQADATIAKLAKDIRSSEQECERLTARIADLNVELEEARRPGVSPPDRKMDYLRRIKLLAGVAAVGAILGILVWSTLSPSSGPVEVGADEGRDGVWAEGTVRDETAIAASTASSSPIEVFRDCDACPEMIALPSGEFEMGSPDGEEGRASDEGPVHLVQVASFALARTEVTFAQWEACASDGGCESNSEPNDHGWGRGDRPVIDVSWNDAQEYIAWLNSKVEGDPYRLPSEAEWEYAARAGTRTPFSFGWTVSTGQANYDSNYTYGEGVKGEYRKKTVPVEDLDAANVWGLRHMHGNVSEWVEDCWHGNYERAPTDGSAWLSADGGDCSRRVVRGGSWYLYPRNLRSALRYWFEPENRNNNLGFRPARTLLTP